MIRSAVWEGRRGAVILGPTEHRAAKYLSDLCRHGRVTVRTVDLARALRLERSEAYRITRRLRVLGLFGIENDKGGTRGGRRYWRTAIPHEGAELDAIRHRTAWARTLAWARAGSARLAARLANLRAGSTTYGPTPAARGPRSRATAPVPAPVPPTGAGTTFGDGLIRGGLRAELAERFGLA